MNNLHEIEIQQQISNSIFLYINESNDLYETIESLIKENSSRLILSIDEFDNIVPNLSNVMMKNPLMYLSACEVGYQKVFNFILDSCKHPNKGEIGRPHLGVSGWLGSHSVTPRGLTARLVNCLVCVEGIVTRCSVVRPKMLCSVHIADETGFALTREHHDYFSLYKDSQLVTRGIPKMDKDGNPIHLELSLSLFKDTQFITLQEMPERSPTGQLPCYLDVALEDDLVDSVKPGDRVRIYGVYRAVASRSGPRISGFGKAFLIGNHVEQLKQASISPDISPIDVKMIREVSQRKDLFDILSQSIAPSICGHDLVKRGLLLQLLGGDRKVLDNGMNIRGDIHILLVGDPSCGKSQLLRFIMNLAPLAISTTGRGSSGVGLTAAVVFDKESGLRRLEAGAMVLGDGGIVCIDEFDKMSPDDRVAIHEVMEQQTVSICKAGVQSTLNARTSVLAAANPVSGSFDSKTPLKNQITFPDSLLTRFDLIYIIKDAQSCEADRKICSKVIRQFQCRQDNMHDNQGMHENIEKVWGILQPNVDKNKREGDSRFWDFSILPSFTVGNPVKVQKILCTEFLQKYLYFVRNTNITPALTDEAMESISKFYSDSRQLICGRGNSNSDDTKIIPTARTLEACVRLATAHAKLRLKDTIDKEDAEEAEKLLLYTLVGQIPEGFSSDGMRIDTEIQDSSNIMPNLAKKRSRIDDNNQILTKKKMDILKDNAILLSENSNESINVTNIIDDQRFEFLTFKLSLLKESIIDSIPIKNLICLINDSINEEEKFSATELTLGLRKLQELNKIMILNDDIWFI